MRWTLLQIRSRRGLIAALLVLLVALFAARAVVHHVAEDAAPAAAIGHHEHGDDGLALDLVAAAAGFLLFAAFRMAAIRPGRPSHFGFALPRLVRFLPAGPPVAPTAPARSVQNCSPT